MKKNKKIILFSILVLVCVLVIAAFLVLHKNKIVDNGISATVTNVVDKPNQAEDGYYSITAQDNNGRRYTINATGYLNTPLTPESRGETCVNVPKVKAGDKISFNLPKIEEQDDTFDICHRNNLTGYYFTLQ